MEEPGENEGAVGSAGYACFVVRVACGSPSHDAIGGLVERLRTGEKRAFATASELVEALSAWAMDRPPQP